jgi:hypothetical protein
MAARRHLRHFRLIFQANGTCGWRMCTRLDAHHIRPFDHSIRVRPTAVARHPSSGFSEHQDSKMRLDEGLS